MRSSLLRVFVATLVLTNISALFAQTQPDGPLPKRHRDELVFVANQSAGALTQIGSPIASGNRTIFIVVEPWGQYVYAANTGSNNISGFSINFDGSLSVVAGSPFSAGDFTAAIAASRNGNFLIAPTGSGCFVYDVTVWGALITVPGSPFTGGGSPNDVAINSTDGFAYAVNLSSNDVSAYRFNDKKGSLIPVTGSPFPAGSFAAAITSAPAPTR